MIKVAALAILVVVSGSHQKVNPGTIPPKCTAEYVGFLLDSGIKPAEVKLICWED